MMNTFLSKKELYSKFPPRLSKILIACPSIRHRKSMTISVFNEFPNKVIFGEEQEQALYQDYMDMGWNWVNQQNPGFIGMIRNQILQYFKDSDYEYLLMIDDEVSWRRVFLNEANEFNTKETNDVFAEWCCEFVRMDKERIDVLTVPNTQYLSANMSKALNNERGVDYCAIAMNKHIFDYNYWYPDYTGPASALELCEDKVYAKILLSNLNLLCTHTLFLRRAVESSYQKDSNFGNCAKGIDAVAGADNVLTQLSQCGYTKQLMEKLWKKEHFPNEFFPIDFKPPRRIQEKQEISKWKRFLM